jgi:hypothetical protein
VSKRPRPRGRRSAAGRRRPEPATLQSDGPTEALLIVDSPRDLSPDAARAWRSRARFARTARPYETDVWYGGMPVLLVSPTTPNVLERAVADTLQAVHLGSRHHPVLLMQPLQIAWTLLERALRGGEQQRRLQGLGGLGVLQLVCNVLAGQSPSRPQVGAMWTSVREVTRNWLRQPRIDDVPDAVRALARRMATGTVRDEELADALGTILSEPPKRVRSPFARLASTSSSPVRAQRRPLPALPGPRNEPPPRRAVREPPSAAALLKKVKKTSGDIKDRDVIHMFEYDLPDDGRSLPVVLATRHGGTVRAIQVPQSVAALFRLVEVHEGESIPDDEIAAETGLKVTRKIVGAARTALKRLGFPDALEALVRDKTLKSYSTEGIWPVLLPAPPEQERLPPRRVRES